MQGHCNTKVHSEGRYLLEESNRPELDELDFAILGHLVAECRKPFTEIATDLGVSYGKILYRYNRMVSKFSLKMVNLLDPNLLGFRAGAQIKFIVEPSKLAATTTAISAFPEVTWLGEWMGEFNVICDVWCWDLENLGEFVSRNLQQLAAIKQMEIAIYSRILKVGSVSRIGLAYSERESGKGAQRQGYPAPSLNRQTARNQQSSGARHLQPINDLDIAILKILGEDGRTPFAEISEALGVSRATVRKRYNGWCETDSLKTVCWFGPQVAGLLVGAHLDLSVDPHCLEDAVSVLVSSPEVAYAAESLGEFSLIAELLCLNVDHVQRFVRNRIQKIRGLRHMEVNVYSGVQKMVTTQNLELLERTTTQG